MRKRKIILLFGILLFTIGQAQVTKTVNLTTAGTLSSTLTSDELSTIENLTISGNINVNDFVTMRDNMPALSVLDLKDVAISSYTGVGTFIQSTYNANEIPGFAFYKISGGKKSLRSIILPTSITSIGFSSFLFCTGLTTITFPPLVTSIGSNAFQDCTGLSTISLPPLVTSIGNNAFQNCTSLTSIILSSSLTSIGNSAFSHCVALTSIIIPSSVTFIGSNSFSGCTGLSSIYSNAVIPVDLSLSDVVFSFVPKATCNLYVPLGSLSLYRAANQWQDFTNIMQLATAVATTLDNRIKISPNPVTDVLHIDGINEKFILNVLDLHGRSLLTKSDFITGVIDLASLPKGIYFVTIKIPEGIIERKIIKE